MNKAQQQAKALSEQPQKSQSLYTTGEITGLNNPKTSEVSQDSGPRIVNSIGSMANYQDIGQDYIYELEQLVSKIGYFYSGATSESAPKEVPDEETLAGFLEKHNRKQSVLNNRLLDIIYHLRSLVGTL